MLHEYANEISERLKTEHDRKVSAAVVRDVLTSLESLLMISFKENFDFRFDKKTLSLGRIGELRVFYLFPDEDDSQRVTTWYPSEESAALLGVDFEAVKKLKALEALKELKEPL